MNRYYNTDSSDECGTLFQLRCLIDRKNVEVKVTKNYHADAAFVDTVVNCHVVAATMTHLGMENINDRPANVPQRIEVLSKEAKARQLRQIARNIIDRYMFRSMTEVIDGIADQDVIPGDDSDGIYNYATGVLKFGLLRRVSMMSTAAGDGLRALRHWRFALLAYHQTRKTKYRLEAFLLTAAVKALLPERFAQELTWSRFVNLTGGPGKNLDADYVLELFNNTVKTKLKTLGSNHTPAMVMRIARTVMFCHNVAKSLGEQLKVAPISRDHTEQDLQKDKGRIIDQLKTKSKVFTFTPGRQHAHFNEPRDIFSGVNVPDLHRWLRDKKNEYANSKWAF